MVTMPLSLELLIAESREVPAALRRARAFGGRVALSTVFLAGRAFNSTARFAVEHRSGLTGILAGVLGGVAGVSLVKGGLDLHFYEGCRDLAAAATKTEATTARGTLDTLANGALPAAGAVVLGGASLTMGHGKNLVTALPPRQPYPTTRFEPQVYTSHYSDFSSQSPVLGDVYIQALDREVSDLMTGQILLGPASPRPGQFANLNTLDAMFSAN